MTGRERQALALTWAAVIGLAGSRWGAYLGISPLYVTDLLLAMGVLHALASHLTMGQRAVSGVAERTNAGLVLCVFLGYAVFRLATSPAYNIVALRDAAPYLYAVVALATASAYARSNQVNRDRSVRLIIGALLVHLGWCAIAVAYPPLAIAMPLVPGGPMQFFSFRGDVDTALIGILIAVAVSRVLRGVHAGRWSLVLVVAALTIARLNSRAGLLAGIATCALVLLGALTSRHLSMSRRATMLALLPIVVAGIAVSLPATNSGQRLIGTVSGDPQSVEQASAIGTARARVTTWSRVIAYTQETSSRQVFGVGFGPDFLSDSGGLEAISGGREGVRSPHDWFIGTYARLGAIGLLLAVALALSVLQAAWRVRRHIMNDDLLLVASTVAVGLLVIGTFGVVLESPFGAVPFFWSAGILLARPTLTPGPLRTDRIDQNHRTQDTQPRRILIPR